MNVTKEECLKAYFGRTYRGRKSVKGWTSLKDNITGWSKESTGTISQLLIREESHHPSEDTTSTFLKGGLLNNRI